MSEKERDRESDRERELERDPELEARFARVPREAEPARDLWPAIARTIDAEASAQATPGATRIPAVPPIAAALVCSRQDPRGSALRSGAGPYQAPVVRAQDPLAAAAGAAGRHDCVSALCAATRRRAHRTRPGHRRGALRSGAAYELVTCGLTTPRRQDPVHGFRGPRGRGRRPADALLTNRSTRIRGGGNP
jgi:hypothetical protein